MQQQKPFTDSHSYIVKQTKIATSKARRRFFGSLFFLIIAFITLFKVTTLNKPLKLNPSTINIETTTTKPIPVIAKTVESIAPVSNAETTQEKVETKHNNSENNKTIFKTSIVSKQIDKGLSPDDILNGISQSKVNIFYIQITTNTIENIGKFKKYAKTNNLTIKINNVNNKLLHIILGDFLNKKDAINEERKLNNAFLENFKDEIIK